jgi:uncharacterized membrane protein
MKLEQYKLVFVALGLVGSLLIASSVVGLFVHLSMGEPFSEIYVLGANQKFADYPYSITLGQNFTLYACVGNHEGTTMYYKVDVKLRNETEPAPNATSDTLQSLYQEQFICQNGQTLQKQLNFTIADASFSGNQSILKSLNINGVDIQINKPAVWDNATQRFFYELFFELSIYNTQSHAMVFTTQYVSLQLNLTQPIEPLTNTEPTSP